jgi:hypothetical protein
MTDGYVDERTVKTRKTHRCDWCGEIIPAGSTVLVIKCVADGKLYNNYFHPECEKCLKELRTDEEYYPQGHILGSDEFRDN